MQLIDMHRIYDIFGDDEEATKKFMKSVLTNTFELLQSLHESIEKKDMATAKDLFHRLKGSAGNCGLVTMNEIAKRAEENVLASHWDAVQTNYTELLLQFELVKSEIAEKFLVSL